MNIVIITSAAFPPREGVGNHIFNVSKNLVARGNEVTIVTRGHRGEKYASKLDGITIYRPHFFPIYPFHVHIHRIFVNKLVKELQTTADLINIHTPLSPVVSSTLPLMTTVHTPMKQDTREVEYVDPFSIAVKLQGKASYLIERELFANSKSIASVSRFVAQGLKEYGLNPKDIFFIGNGVDDKKFMPQQRPNAKKQYVLFVGRLSYRKGLFDLLKSAKHVAERYPHLLFMIVGQGRLENQIRKYIWQMKLQKNIVLLGFVSRHKLIELFQHATVFVLPSVYEGLATTLLEAMATGLPVVATSIRCNMEVINHRKNGIIVPTHSPKKMAEAIIALLDDKKLRRRLGSKARSTIQEKFTWRKVTDRTEKCYNNLLLG
ncbi:MAG: glycosyltransferase family 4 protein [Candidatus Bathyarchaeota archaeon]|jgi:glycosyltransferase involved in cell wall biosynthesis